MEKNHLVFGSFLVDTSGCLYEVSVSSTWDIYHKLIRHTPDLDSLALSPIASFAAEARVPSEALESFATPVKGTCQRSACEADNG